MACERDQWSRAIAGRVNVAPRHLSAEAETLLSATLIHEGMHVLGCHPHAFAHFRDERKRRRREVVAQEFDSNLRRMVTRIVLPRVVARSRQHYGVCIDLLQLRLSFVSLGAGKETFQTSMLVPFMNLNERFFLNDGRLTPRISVD